MELGCDDSGVLRASIGNVRTADSFACGLQSAEIGRDRHWQETQDTVARNRKLSRHYLKISLSFYFYFLILETWS